MLLLLLERLLLAGYATATIFFTGIVMLATYGYRLLEPARSKIHVNGFCSKRFEPVLQAFKMNLAEGWERDGAAFAVYMNGRLVVDLWGGFADRDAERLWRRDTLNVAFSTSKAVGAVCIALLVDRGLLAYDDVIATFWPAFAVKGKSNITVQMVMSHTAGLPLLTRKITIEDAMDHNRMAAILEEERPIWEPGTAVGYHALSYGWLVDQIIRRVDPRSRGVGAFFREEIAEPHGIDFHFGLNPAEAHRVSRLTNPRLLDRIFELLSGPTEIDCMQLMYIFAHLISSRGLLLHIGANPSWLQFVLRMPLNNPELYVLEQCALFGIGTARDLARIFQLVVDGKIISKKLLERLCEPSIPDSQPDVVTNFTQARGYGLTHQYNHDRYGILLLGHAGFGGQNVRMDVVNGVSFAYMSNGLKGGFGDRARTYRRLLDALYECVPADQHIGSAHPSNASDSAHPSNASDSAHPSNASDCAHPSNASDSAHPSNASDSAHPSTSSHAISSSARSPVSTCMLASQFARE